MPVEATAQAAASQTTAALKSISEAGEIFYRNLQQQITLMELHLQDILNLAAAGMAFARGELGPDEKPEDRAARVAALEQGLEQERRAIEEALHSASATGPAAGGAASPSDEEAARMNLANVVNQLNLLMANAVAAHRKLDVLGEAVLAQAASLILKAPVSPSRAN